jgi:hypothetical protein
MKSILTLLFATLTLSIKGQDNTFIPDTSLSGLKLQDSISLRSIIPEFMEKIDFAGPGARLFIFNKDKTETATLIFHSGSQSDLIAEIKLNAFMDSEYIKDKSFKLNIDHFKTESNIKLGITKAELVQLKGEAYIIDKMNGKETLKYRITNDETSSFLIRYNYPSYYANYEFEKGLLKSVSFGFEYP